MAEGLASATADAILDALCNNTPLAVAQLYVKLHVGAPGAAGTSNPATETTRKSVSFGAASGGSIANDAEIEWTNIPTADPEDPTHFTVWDDLTAGNFRASGLITGNSISDGDTYRAAIGAFTLSFPIAS